MVAARHRLKQRRSVAKLAAHDGSILATAIGTGCRRSFGQRHEPLRWTSPAESVPLCVPNRRRTGMQRPRRLDGLLSVACGHAQALWIPACGESGRDATARVGMATPDTCPDAAEDLHVSARTAAFPRHELA